MACVFLSYFFMSIMFPTIFALGIYRPGRARQESLGLYRDGDHGRRLLPKLMGYVADQFDMSRGFIVPAVLLRLRGVLWLQVAAVQRG